MGSAPTTAVATMRARGVRPASRADPLGADQHQRGAVDDARGVARRCGRGRSSRPSGTSAAPRRRSRPSRRCRRTTGLSLPRLSSVVPGRMCSSWSSTTSPLRSLTGTTELREAAVGPRLRGPLLGHDGVRVDVVAGEALDGGDQVGADALRHEVGVVGGLRVHRPGAAVGAHRHAAHRLDAAGEDQGLPAGADLGRGEVDGLEAGGAEAVELDAGAGGVGQARGDRGGPGDVRRPGRRPGVTQPRTMSSTSSGSSPGLRSRISWMRSASR